MRLISNKQLRGTMKTNYLFNKEVIESLVELWTTHSLPVEITYGKFDNGLAEVSIEHDEKDELLEQWLVERATS